MERFMLNGALFHVCLVYYALTKSLWLTPLCYFFSQIPSSGVTDFLGFADTPRNLITFPNVPDGYFGCNSSKMQL